jgi:Mn-dependent DtxR family transcriptional regulator
MKQTMLAVVAPPEPSPADQVLSLMAGQPVLWRASDVRERTEMRPETIGACFANLSARGLIKWHEQGGWEVTPAGREYAEGLPT